MSFGTYTGSRGARRSARPCGQAERGGPVDRADAGLEGERRQSRVGSRSAKRRPTPASSTART